jgi:hypothetical protein
MRLYVDGALDSNGSDNPKAYAGGIFDGTATFRIGAWGNTSTEHFDGLIDEVGFYNRALSATEIADIFNNGIQDPPAAATNFPTTAILDSFTRADATSLGANWTNLFGDPEDGGISSNQAYNPDGNYYPMAWNVSQYGPDCETYITMPTLTGGDDSFYLGGRAVDLGGGSFTGYALAVDVNLAANEDIFLARVDAGVLLQISPTISSVNMSAGDSFGIRMEGPIIRAFHKPAAGSWTEVLNVVDTTYSSAGYLFMYLTTNITARFDDFGGGTVIGQPTMRRWGGIPGLNQYTGRRGW